MPDPDLLTQIYGKVCSIEEWIRTRPCDGHEGRITELEKGRAANGARREAEGQAAGETAAMYRARTDRLHVALRWAKFAAWIALTLGGLAMGINQGRAALHNGTPPPTRPASHASP